MSRENTKAAALDAIQDYFDGGDFEAELSERVAMPTESQRVEGLPFCADYLEQQMKPCLEAIGFSCRIFDNPVPSVGPLLLATRHESDQLPTVLGYGHGDVIRGLEDQWTRGSGPGIRTIAAGTFDDPSWLQSDRYERRHVFTRSAQDWATIPDDVKRYEEHFR